MQKKKVKRGIKQAAQKAQSEKRLWNCCGETVTAIRRMTAHYIPSPDGMCPDERVHNRNTGISAYAPFDWYEYVWFVGVYPAGQMSQLRRQLGRWIGVAGVVGGPKFYYELPKSYMPLPLSCVFPVLPDVQFKPEQVADLDVVIRQIIGGHQMDDEIEEEIGMPEAILPEIFEDDNDLVEQIEPGSMMPEADDQYLAAELLLERNGETQRGVVQRRKVDDDGNPVGVRNSNPTLDTRVYEVEFPDKSVETLSVDLLADAMYSQVDNEGRSNAILDEITDHRKDGSAVSMNDGVVPWIRHPRRTTEGWQLLVVWRDETSVCETAEWVSLRIDRIEPDACH